MTLWEAVASVQIGQAMETGLPTPEEFEAIQLFDIAGIPVGDYPLNYDKAYREVSHGYDPYVSVLAKHSRFEAECIQEPKFEVEIHEGYAEKYILLCPFAPMPEVELPGSVWRPLTRFLRTYPVPVKLMGAQGQRMDDCGFAEYETMSELRMYRKLQYIQNAEVLIGVPNEWMWLATAWKKKLIVLYPDNIPAKRWFHWAHDNYGRCVYERHQIQAPVMLAGVRQLLRNL